MALQYSGEGHGSILVLDFSMTSRGAAVQFLSQHPHEEELLFPPLTAFQCLGASEHRPSQVGAKRLVLVTAQVSTACEDTSRIGSPETTPEHKRGWSGLKGAMAFTRMAQAGADAEQRSRMASAQMAEISERSRSQMAEISAERSAPTARIPGCLDDASRSSMSSSRRSHQSSMWRGLHSESEGGLQLSHRKSSVRRESQHGHGKADGMLAV